MPIDKIPSNDEARDYIEAELKKVLVQGLSELVKVRPQDQIGWLSEYLLTHNPNKPAVQLGRN